MRGQHILWKQRPTMSQIAPGEQTSNASILLHKLARTCTAESSCAQALSDIYAHPPRTSSDVHAPTHFIVLTNRHEPTISSRSQTYGRIARCAPGLIAVNSVKRMEKSSSGSASRSGMPVYKDTLQLSYLLSYRATPFVLIAALLRLHAHAQHGKQQIVSFFYVGAHSYILCR